MKFLKFRVDCNSSEIDYAVFMVLQHLQTPEFYAVLAGFYCFHYTKKTTKQVIKDIININQTFTVQHYKSFWPWSKSIAMSTGSKIFINKRHKHLTSAQIAEALVHEIMHYLGYEHTGKHKTPHNELSVPYAVSGAFKNFLWKSNTIN